MYVIFRIPMPTAMVIINYHSLIVAISIFDSNAPAALLVTGTMLTNGSIRTRRRRSFSTYMMNFMHKVHPRDFQVRATGVHQTRDQNLGQWTQLDLRSRHPGYFFHKRYLNIVRVIYCLTVFLAPARLNITEIRRINLRTSAASTSEMVSLSVHVRIPEPKQEAESYFIAVCS